MPYLTIQKELDISTSPEFKSLKDDNERYRALAQKYFINGLELIDAKRELVKEKSKNMTTEEKKQAIIEFAKNFKPSNEDEKRFKERLKNVLEIE
jgi:sulfur transfer protein SufE